MSDAATYFDEVGGEVPELGASTVSVHPEAVTAHEGEVRQFAERARIADTAARTVMVDVGAYGQLCRGLPVALRPVQQRVAVVSAATTQRLDAIAMALRAAVDAYAAVDEAAQRRLSGHRSGLSR